MDAGFGAEFDAGEDPVAVDLISCGLQPHHSGSPPCMSFLFTLHATPLHQQLRCPQGRGFGDMENSFQSYFPGV